MESPVADDEFEVSCIPFLVYGVALGDLAQTSTRGARRHMVAGVIRPSGRFVFHVWLGESFQPRQVAEKELHGLGALTEWSSVSLLGVDAEDARPARAVEDYLLAREQRGELIYETGRSA